MRKKISLWGLVLALGAVLLLSPAPAPAETMELMLLVDVSGSINTTEFNLQRQGYVNAFTNTVANLFNNPNITVDPFYVSYGVWSGASQQSQLVGWTLISNAAQATAFGNAIGVEPRTYSGLTAVQTALNWGAGLFSYAAGYRQVIDISGDGVRNDGLTGTVGRDNALGAGVDRINGLVIGSTGADNLYNYYRDFVIGGTSPFLLTAADFADFEGAIARKITFEVLNQNVPVPPSVLLLGSGLLGLVGWRRFRKN